MQHPDLPLQHPYKTVKLYIWNNWNTWNVDLQHVWKRMKTVEKNTTLPTATTYLMGNCGGVGLPFLPTMQGGWGHKRAGTCLPRRRRSRAGLPYLPFYDEQGGWGTTLDGGAAQARGVAREGARCFAGRSSARTVCHAGEMLEQTLHAGGGSRKDRAPYCRTLR
jgi:hypothetical protein